MYGPPCPVLVMSLSWKLAERRRPRGFVDSRRSRCGNQKPYQEAIPYKTALPRAHSRGNADHGEVPVAGWNFYAPENGVNYFGAEAIASQAPSPASASPPFAPLRIRTAAEDLADILGVDELLR